MVLYFMDMISNGCEKSHAEGVGVPRAWDFLCHRKGCMNLNVKCDFPMTPPGILHNDLDFVPCVTETTFFSRYTFSQERRDRL